MDQQIKEKELSISNTEEKYRQLIEQAGDAIVVYSIDGSIHEFNNMLCTVSGYSRDECKELKLQDILIGKLIENPSLYELMIKGETVTLYRQFKRKDNAFVDMEIRVKSIGDEKFLAFARDITERKKAELALKESFEVQKLIMDSALDAIVCIDINGSISFWNPVAEKIFGWSSSEVLGSTISETIIPVRYREMHSDGMKRYLQTGTAKILNRTIEITALNRKGEEFSIDLSIVSIQQSNKPFFCAFIRDISERKKAENELRKLKESYLALINNVDGIVWEADAKTFEFTFVSENAERLLGYPKEKWLEKPRFWADHIYKEDRGWAIDYCMKCTKEKISHDFEYWMIAADGRLVWLRDIVSVQVENDEPVKLSGIMVDITNQKISEEENREKKEQLRLLAAYLQKIREDERTSIAREIHDELGQQLTVMKMDVSWLEDNLKNQNEKVLNKITDFKIMIDQTVSTVRRIAYELRPSMLDDMGLVAAIEWQLIEFEKRSGVRTKYTGIKSTLTLSDTVKTCLFRIVQESLTNVGRYAKAKNVSVSLMETDQQVVLKILDDGIGFELEKLAFKKTLGIVGMKERCLMLGGEFKIDSTQGGGTKIKIIIPAQVNLNEAIA